MRERLELLRERYYLFAGPLALLLGLAAFNDSAALAWVAGILLVLLTINWLVGLARRS